MIRRDRPAPGIRPRLDRRAREDVDPLPEWRPRAPAGGWTPSTARAAAEEYASEAVAERPDLLRDRVVESALHALKMATPGLAEADVYERLVAARVARDAARSAAPEPADEAPPF